MTPSALRGDVLAAACLCEGLSVEAACGRDVSGPMREARARVMIRLAARGWSTPVIGRALNRDHSTVVTAINRRLPNKERPMTPRERQCLNVIVHLMSESPDGLSPTYREIARQLNLTSISGVHRLITGLAAQGYIAIDRHRARAITVLKTDSLTDSLHMLIKLHGPETVKWRLNWLTEKLAQLDAQKATVAA